MVEVAKLGLCSYILLFILTCVLLILLILGWLRDGEPYYFHQKDCVIWDVGYAREKNVYALTVKFI